ncbi:MAG: hypothetical protein LBR81_04300 [Prevotellaceae bacterium]|nr:hypothetical protein [Prevotellaceae bacterium]
MGTGIILLPFILRSFPQETVGIWSIFSTIIALTALLDFGFNVSFARNISYVISGVKELKTTGFHQVEKEDNKIDYSLYRGLIDAMRWFYTRIAIILLAVLGVFGTFYMYRVLESYSGNHSEVYIAWIILCLINSYSLYTLYYDALLHGKGLIKRAKQIQAIGQIVYLLVAIVLIYFQFNLIAIVSAQALSILIRRILSHKTIYTFEFKKLLYEIEAQNKKEILKPIYRNAIKLGIVNTSNFLILRSPVLIGAMFISLNEIASYGITIQIINVIASVATVYITTFLPKIAQLRIHNDTLAIKKIYLNSCFFMLFTFFVGGLCLFLFGNWALHLIGSQTPLLASTLIIIALIASWLDYNRGMAECVLATKNDIPFFKASLFTGGLSVILLFLSLKYINLGVGGLILAPATAQICYQNWKWPLEVAKELKIISKK